MKTSKDIKMIGHERLPFSLDEYRRRYDLVLEGMATVGVDVLLVRGPENICYLTGYETPGYYGYHCLVISPDAEPVMVLRRLEQPNVWEFSWLAESEIIPDTRVPHEVTVEVLRDRGLAARRIGVDKAAYFFTVEEYEALVASLPEATFVNAAGLVEQARLVKSEAEIDIMRGCARMLDGGMRAGVDAVRAGATEDDIAAEVHRVLVGAGSEYPSLPHFICSGPRLSMPHATWRGRVLEKGDPVFFELSATKYRYSASLMLTACDGEPEPRVRHFADACLAGLQAAKDTIAPGVTCEEVDAALHGAFEKAGIGQYHAHRAGYSIGLGFPPDWGEGHILSLKQGEQRPLERNMTFHLVPAAFIYRETGAGFSATVRVTDDGCEDLSAFPRELIVK